MDRIAVARTAAVALLIAVPAAARAQQHFEGVVHVTVTSQRGPQDVVYTLKGDKTRVDLDAGPMGTMSMITDAGAHKVTMVMPMRQMYMERDMDTTMYAEQQAKGGASVSWTGKTETIAGYQCEHATITSTTSDEKYDACIAKGLPNFFGGQGGMGRGGRGNPNAEWQRLIHGGFPLKVQKNGEAAPLFTVTSIEKKAVDDSQFAAPAGFTKMDMPMMGRP